MNALAYLVRKQFINFFRDLFHHPARLVGYIISAAFVLMALIMPSVDPSKNAGHTDIRILHGAIYGLMLFLGIPSLISSLKSGTTMFKMSDVNFLFVSPISPKKILNYGLLKQMVTTLLGFVFLLCYSGTVMQNFKITAAGMLIFLAYFVAMLFLVQVLSLLIYSYTNGNVQRQSMVRTVLYAFFALMALAVIYLIQKNGGGVNGLLAAAASREMEYFPIFGWAKGAAFAMVVGNITLGLIYTALLAVMFFICLVLFEHSDTDYYEDVLEKTETMFEAKQAMKERRTMQTKKKVRVGRTGLGKGWGANALFYKHLCEARRRSRLVFISLSTVLIALGNVVLGILIATASKGDSDAPTPDQMMLMLMAADVYVLFLMSAAGDWSREIQKPYIYLIPEESFPKLIWASMTSIMKAVVDGAFFAVAACIAVKAQPLTGLIFFLGYVSVSLLFLAGNILSQRTMGSMSNRGFVAVLYMLLLILLLLPGVVGGVILYFTVLQNVPGIPTLFLAGLPFVVWNVLVSTVIIYCCRNLLSNAEISK